MTHPGSSSDSDRFRLMFVLMLMFREVNMRVNPGKTHFKLWINASSYLSAKNTKHFLLPASHITSGCLSWFPSLSCDVVRTLFVCVTAFQPSSILLSISFFSPFVPGKRQDPDEAKNYIRKLYEQQANNADKRDDWKTLYPHFTCATDTNNIRRVFSDVKDTVLLKSLRDYGVI